MPDPQKATVAEEMIVELQKISQALSQMRGLPRVMIIAYLQKKTHLAQRDIKVFLEALEELNKEVRPKQ